VIGVHFSNDGFVRKFTRTVRTARNPRQVMLAAGRRGANELKAHFREKHRSEPNKLGGKRENFWLQIGRSVNAPVVESPLRVSVAITDSRFAQKLFGGVIRAKRVRNLAIPRTPDAYGRAPATFERETGLKLFLLPSEFGGGRLAAMVGNAVVVQYLLRPSVRQKKDPTALPPQDQLEAAVYETARQTLDRQLRQGGPSQ
jgi:hypothetical protein